MQGVAFVCLVQLEDHFAGIQPGVFNVRLDFRPKDAGSPLYLAGQDAAGTFLKPLGRLFEASLCILNVLDYVVIDLKTVPFQPEFAGKMNFYLNCLEVISPCQNSPSPAVRRDC